MNLSRYLNQTVSYTPYEGGTDSWGNRTLGTPRTIPARYEERQRLVRNQNGAEQLSEAVVLTEEEIQTGELIEGREVQARENFVDLRGNVVGWRSFL